MSLFDAISTPKWQHKKPEIRLQAVAELEDQDLLLTLLRSDPDGAVQAAALGRIDTPETLDDLILTLTGKLQLQARQQRLRQLLADPNQLTRITDDALLLRIAELGDDEKLIDDSIAQIKDKALRQNIASTHAVARIRLMAASGIDDLAVLAELMSLSRGRDKGVYRHCKARLDQHEAGQKAETERAQKIQQLMQDARSLVETVNFTEFKGRYIALQQQWKGLAGFAAAAEIEAFGQLMTACSHRLEQASEEIAAQQQAQVAAETAHQLQDQLVAELTAFSETATAPDNAESLKQLKLKLADFKERWQATALASTTDSQNNAQAAKAFTGLMAGWQDLIRTAQKLVDQESQLNTALKQAAKIDRKDYQALQKSITHTKKLLARFPWPEGLNIKAPEPLQQLQLALEGLQTGLKELDSSQPQQLQRVQTLLQKLESELEQNQTKAADRALNKLRLAMAALKPDQRQELEHQIKPLAARLNEVHDWQGFAIEPKKLELCESMQALIGSTEDPEMLAVKIQTLQEQWKQAGALPHAREQELWLQFKAASDEAWKPCKAEFARRAKLHRENFKRRMQLVAQLKAYDQAMAWPETAAAAEATDQDQPGPAPDWRKVQKTLDTAREEFRHIQPVDPKAARQSQQAFREICDRIYSHISKEYERNIALKQELVERAQKLVEQDDLPKSIDQAKRMQQEWKAVGMTPVKADRGLWQAFRAACDAVFERLGAKRNQEQAATSEQIQQAESLRDQARALLQAEDAEPSAPIISSLENLKQQFYGLDLPPPVRQRLLKELQTIEKQARDRVQQAKARQEQASWTTLGELIQAAAANGKPSGEAEAAAPDANHLPKGVDAAALVAFHQQGPADEPDEVQREACIALEVLTETASPAEDKQARMKYQMKRLAEGMGNAVVDTEQALLDNINAFIALRPGVAWAQRYCAVLKQRVGSD